MSQFNKPKRNIRRRPFDDEDEDNENRMEVEDAQPVKVKTKKKDKPKQTRLSFGEELEQGTYAYMYTCTVHARRHLTYMCIYNYRVTYLIICLTLCPVLRSYNVNVSCFAGQDYV